MEGYLARSKLELKVSSENWLFRIASSTTKPYREYHISNFPAPVREKIVNKLIHYHWQPSELWKLTLSDICMWHDLLVVRLKS